jgi:hypothetical protein
MKEWNTHQCLAAVIYTTAIIAAIVWLTYSGGPSDAEMRLRCSQPISNQ